MDHVSESRLPSSHLDVPRGDALFLILAISAFVGSVGLLVWTHYKTPVERRPVVRWAASGVLLFASSGLLGQVASQLDWTLHHSAVGAAVLLLDLAFLACLAKAMFSMWRLQRAGRQKI
jgi:hypothetical protein